MCILPVIDLKGGVVVRAVAGRRHEYQPIRSQIALDAMPDTVAQAFSDKCGFSSAYVADLDAIAGAKPNWTSLDQIARAGLKLVVDAGIASLERALQFAEFTRRTNHDATVVVGSEVIRDSEGLRAIFEIHGLKQPIFSLDLRDARPIVANPSWSNATPLEIVADVIAVGYRRLIVLDLKSVGTAEGPTTTNLCQQLRERYPSIELISGGGVRNIADVRILWDAGCNQVLVASALHNGMLTGKWTTGK